MDKYWRFIAICALAALIAFAYGIGLCTGYAIGYFDNYAKEVVEYKNSHRR